MTQVHQLTSGLRNRQDEMDLLSKESVTGCKRLVRTRYDVLRWMSTTALARLTTSTDRQVPLRCLGKLNYCGNGLTRTRNCRFLINYARLFFARSWTVIADLQNWTRHRKQEVTVSCWHIGTIISLHCLTLAQIIQKIHHFINLYRCNKFPTSAPNF